jgi:MFS family permease
MFQVGVGSFAATSLLAGLSPTAGVLIVARVLQGLSGGLINPQVSGLVQQMFRPAERGRAFGVLGTTVGVGTALGPLVGGGVIALGGPHLGWRLVFFINVPIAVVVIWLARRLLPSVVRSGHHRLDVVGSGLLGGATFCVLFAAVEYDTVRDARLALLAVPAVLLLVVFLRRERRLTQLERDPLVDFRLFREPSYTAGLVLAITFFPAMAGLPLVLALYYQQGLGYTALQSGLGVTAYAIGSSIAAPLAGRIVTRVGRPLVVAGTGTFGAGAIGLAIAASNGSALLFAPALLVMGFGQGAVITPNQALTLMEVDPITGSTAGGVLQTAQRIGLAIGQAVVGSVFFASVGDGRYGHALRMAVIAGLIFVAVSAVVGMGDLLRNRRRGGSVRREPVRVQQDD